jgi:hypothetical protein
MIPEGRLWWEVSGWDCVRVGTKWVRKRVLIKVGIGGWGGKNPDCLLVKAKWKYGGGE